MGFAWQDLPAAPAPCDCPLCVADRNLTDELRSIAAMRALVAWTRLSQTAIGNALGIAVFLAAFFGGLFVLDALLGLRR